MKQITTKTNGTEALGPHKMRKANNLAVLAAKARRRKHLTQQNTYRAAMGLPLK